MMSYPARSLTKVQRTNTYIQFTSKHLSAAEGLVNTQYLDFDCNKYHLATSAWSNVSVCVGSVVKATIRKATAMNILRSPWTGSCMQDYTRPQTLLLH